MTAVSSGSEPDGLRCPKCRQPIKPERHADLVFDGQIWCDACHLYDRELIRPRAFAEIKAWAALICHHFGFAPVPLEEKTDPRLFRQEESVVTAEADHRQKAIVIYPPGCRLVTLCHELAHIVTGQDHTREWAQTCARLVAWVKGEVSADRGPAGFPARLPIYEAVQGRVY